MTLIHDPITFVLICLVCHFLADFNLQLGAHLGDFKQRSWWIKMLGIRFDKYPENSTDQNDKRLWKMYGKDYISALLIHAFIWSVITFLPYIVSGNYTPWKMLMTVILNTGLHAWIDNLKCNKLQINLNQDQMIHFLQVVGFSLILWYI